MSNDLFARLEKDHGLPGGLLDAVWATESSRGKRMVSPAGARGHFQFMPATAKQYGLADPDNLEQSAAAAARMFADLSRKYSGDLPKVLAGYNWGMGNVDRKGLDKAPAETRNYIEKVSTGMKPSATPAASAGRDFSAELFGSAPVASVAAAPTAPAGRDYSAELFGGDSASPVSTSAMENLPAAIGMGAHKLYRAATQPLGLYSPEELAEANRLDQPLEAAPGGTTGKVIGQVAPAVAASFIPGGQSLAGSAVLGGVFGGLGTEGGLAERIPGAILGAAGGAAGKVAGDLIGKGAGAVQNYLTQRNAQAAAANAGKDAAAAAAQKAGYVMPPSDVNPSLLNKILGGMSGKIKTAQEASTKNQKVTNELAATGLGLPKDTVLNKQVLDGVRKQAGQAYDDVAKTGTVVPGPQYAKDLDKITAPYVVAAQSFPNAKTPAVLAEIEALHTTQFNAASAVAKIRTLREAADSAYGSGDKAAGKALRDGAKALEDALEDHVSKLGKPDLLSKFKEARTRIAKTYSVQAGLNDTTGDVAANALARQLQKGKPLTGDLETIARAGQAFPKATQALKEPTGAVSPLDFAVSATTGFSTGNPLSALMLAARPAVRSIILSKPYQNALAAPPSYGTNPLAELLLQGAQRPMLPNLLAATGATQAPEVNRRGR